MKMIKEKDILQALRDTFEDLKEMFLTFDIGDFDHNEDFVKLANEENLEKRKFYGYLETIFGERYNQVEYFINNFDENVFINNFIEHYYSVTGETPTERTNTLLAMILSDFIAFLDDYFYSEQEVFDFSEIEANNQQVEFIKDNIEGLANIQDMFASFFDESFENLLNEYDFGMAIKDIEGQLK